MCKIGVESSGLPLLPNIKLCHTDTFLRNITVLFNPSNPQTRVTHQHNNIEQGIDKNYNFNINKFEGRQKNIRILPLLQNH